MTLPIEAAVPLFTLGWVAGVGTALVCRPARSSRTCRELMRDPAGWRSYAPVSRPRHANSDNGVPSTAKPPIEPQGQALVKPSFPPPRKIREGFTAEETQVNQYRGDFFCSAGGGGGGSAPPASTSGYEVYANLRHPSELQAELLAHQANIARIKAEQASAAARRRPGIWQPRATGQGDPLSPPANP